MLISNKYLFKTRDLTTTFESIVVIFLGFFLERQPEVGWLFQAILVFTVGCAPTGLIMCPAGTRAVLMYPS